MRKRKRVAKKGNERGEKEREEEMKKVVGDPSL